MEEKEKLISIVYGIADALMSTEDYYLIKQEIAIERISHRIDSIINGSGFNLDINLIFSIVRETVENWTILTI